jgi:hypothetical protein
MVHRPQCVVYPKQGMQLCVTRLKRCAFYCLPINFRRCSRTTAVSNVFLEACSASIHSYCLVTCQRCWVNELAPSSSDNSTGACAKLATGSTSYYGNIQRELPWLNYLLEFASISSWPLYSAYQCPKMVIKSTYRSVLINFDQLVLLRGLHQQGLIWGRRNKICFVWGSNYMLSYWITFLIKTWKNIQWKHGM